MNSIIKVKFCTESVPKAVILNLFQNLHTYFKLGDAGSVSGMTKLSLFVFFMLCGSPAIAQEKSINWYPFEEAIQIAEENQQFILVDVWAPWCGWCKKMEKEVYPNIPKVLSSQFIWTRLNRDDHKSRHNFNGRTLTPLRLAQTLNVAEVPALVFLTPQADYLFHTSGYTETETLDNLMQYVSSKAYEKLSIEKFLANQRN